MAASPAHDGSRSYRSALIATAGGNAHRPALTHRQDGLVVVWRWRTAVDEIDRLSAGLEAVGLRSGDRVIVAGATTGPVLLAAAAAKAAGAELIQPAAAITEETARALLRDPAVSVVVGDGPAETAVWRAAASRSRPVAIVTRSDDGRSGGGRVVTLDRLRTLASRRGWADGLPDVPTDTAGPATVAPGDTTIDALLAAWAETGETLTLAEAETASGSLRAARRTPGTAPAGAAGLPAAAAFAVRMATALSARARTKRWRTAFALIARLIAQRSARSRRPAPAEHASAANPAR
jgi:acyl-CoA synthetase (AMP-forming)/AMP-acid ligase II